MIALTLAVTLGGSTPPALVAPSRIVYVSADTSDGTSCRLLEGDQWTCQSPSAQVSGIVVIVGQDAIAYRSPTLSDASFHVRSWGRLLMVEHGSIADADVARAKVTAWTPTRFRSQPHSTRLVAAQDPSIDVVTLAPGVFWVAGGETDVAAFLMVGGGEFAATRLMIRTLIDGDVAAPFVVAPSGNSLLEGRVQDSHGNDVAETEVESFELLEPPTEWSGLPDDQLAAAPMVRTALVQTRSDGTFTFDHVSAGPFVLIVTDRLRGRGRAVVRSSHEPALIRLKPPTYATGRVLRDHLPAEGVRVRLIPDPRALAGATDVRDLAAPELTTAADGRFAIVLPPVLSGALLFVAPDGASIRVPLPAHVGTGDLNVGDVMLAAPQRVAVRLFDGDGCVLSAIGPIGALGASIVRQSAVAGIVHWLDVTETGAWQLQAECGNRPGSLIPDAFVVSDTGPPPVVDARVIQRR